MASSRSAARRSLGAAIVLLGAAFAVRWPFRSTALIRDEGEYLHLAQALRSGIVPYLELYNQKPPFAFVFAAGVQAVFGESVEAIRVATTLWVLGGGVLVAMAAHRVAGTRASVFGLAAYCAMSFDQAGIVHAMSTEALMLPWLGGGVAAWLSARRTGRLAPAIVAGVCAGFAVQTKQTGAVLALAIAADTSFAEPEGRRDALRAGAGVLLGFAAATLVVLAPLAAVGTLDAYFDAVWRHNFAYVGARHASGGVGSNLLALPRIANADLGFWLVGGFGALACLADRRRTPVVGWLALGCAAAALAAGHPYVHYYTPLVVPFALGFGWFAVRAFDAARDGARHAGVRGLAVVLLVLPWIQPLAHHAERLASRDRIARESESVAARAGAFLRERTAQGEEVLVVGSEPHIYFHAGRPAATRFPIMYPLTGGYPHSRALAREFTSGLREAAPRWVAFALDWRSYAEKSRSGAEWRASLRALLERRYRPERDFGGRVLVLRRVGDPARAPGSTPDSRAPGSPLR